MLLTIGGCSGSAPTATAPSQVPNASISSSAVVQPSAGASSQSATGWIAWQTDHGLALVRPDGSGAHDLFPGESQTFESHHPDWSPAGDLLAFVSDATDGTSDIWTVHADGSGRQRLIDCQKPCEFVEDPAWSPDGTRIAYWTNGDGQPQVVRVADAKNGTVLQTIPAANLDGPVEPRWSPDGQHLAVEVGHYAPDATGGGFHEVSSAIGVIDLTATKPAIRRVTDPKLLALYPDWAPSGDILFVAGNLAPFERSGGPTNLFTVHPDGTHLVQLTHRGPADPWIANPAWTTGGTTILLTIIGAANSLATMNAHGTGLKDLVDPSGMPIGGAHPRRSFPTN